ncbi:response regulator, partial [Halioglobus sp. HI00S01]
RRILVAEDNLADAELIKEMLNRAFPQHLEACFVTRLDDTLAAIERNVFDILLLDLGLPDHQGVDKIDDISNRV